MSRLLDLYTSYYGGFLCVCWSPDAKYVLTGGQDDLVSIWSVADATIVARCQGHQSWVTAVCFDPWRCDEKNYRFGSVGEDCRLLLWDFSVGMLHRPKAVRYSLHALTGAIRLTVGSFLSDIEEVSRLDFRTLCRERKQTQVAANFLQANRVKIQLSIKLSRELLLPCYHPSW